MKIFIMTDLEGISGISRIEQVSDTADEGYKYSLERLMSDVNAAIRGAYDGGADEVFVEDGHGGGDNFIAGALDSRAVQSQNMGRGCGDLTKCDAVFMIGAHAMSGTLNAFLDHTQSSVSWHDYYINGHRCGEMGQTAAFAGAFGIPVVMVSGDFAACAEARQFFGNIKTAAVKFANGRNNAECINNQTAEQLIYNAAREAVGIIGEIKPFRVLLPAEIKLELNRADYCDWAARADGVERLDARTVRKIVDKIEVFRDILL